MTIDQGPCLRAVRGPHSSSASLIGEQSKKRLDLIEREEDMNCGIRGCVLDRRYTGELVEIQHCASGLAGEVCHGCSELVYSQKALERLDRMRRRARRLGIQSGVGERHK